MRVFIFSNLLLEFPCKSFTLTGILNDYAACASAPKRFSRRVKLETRAEKTGCSRRLEERETGDICPKVPCVPYFPGFPFRFTDHTTGHQRYETTGIPPSVRVAEETQMNIYRPKHGFEPSPMMALV